MPSIDIVPEVFKADVGKAANKHSSKLFSTLTNKSVTYKNRVVLPPMCMYSANDGFFNDFHFAHYSSFALKGVGLIIIEATAVEARGRISSNDAGLWSDSHIAPLKRIVEIIQSQGSVAALQIAHAGRKASGGSLWSGDNPTPKSEGGWPDEVVGPSNVPFSEAHPKPQALTISELQQVKQSWVDAAIRADKAGVEVLEVHSAHGYLLQSFLSGHSNKRTDIYGGSLENRMRYPLEVVKAVREVWPEHKPLWVRISGTDFKTKDTLARDDEGWDIYQSVEYAKQLKELGVDVIDVSGGGNRSDGQYPTEYLYQVEMANVIKHQANIATGAVGRIVDPLDAEKVLKEDKADYIMVGRAHLFETGWVNHAARALGVEHVWANQYFFGNRISFFPSSQ